MNEWGHSTELIEFFLSEYDVELGTFAVNTVGCFAVGLLATLADEQGWITPHTRFFLVAGLLGGFTTFSTFGLETWRLVEEREALFAIGNAVASVTAGLVAVIAGVVVGRSIG